MLKRDEAKRIERVDKNRWKQQLQNRPLPDYIPTQQFGASHPQVSIKLGLVLLEHLCIL